MHPKGQRTLRGSVSSDEVKLLQRALSAARFDSCSCSEAAKEEVRNYLESWVAKPIETVLSGLKIRQNKREGRESPDNGKQA